MSQLQIYRRARIGSKTRVVDSGALGRVHPPFTRALSKVTGIL